MPYPNEHSCRLEDPKKYERFRSSEKEISGKKVRMIFGFKKDGGSELQAIRYNKEIWKEADARKDCKDRGGMFEKAVEDQEFYTNPKFNDFIPGV